MKLKRQVLVRQSKTFARKRLGKSVIISTLIVVSAGSWLFALSRLSGIGLLTLDQVEVFGATGDAMVSIQSAAMNAIDGKYLGLFSKSNVLLYPKGEIMSAISSASAAVSDARVEASGLHTLKITIKSKNPTALLCPKLPDFDENGAVLADKAGECSFVDEDGNIFGEAPSLSGNVYDRYYLPSATSTVSVVSNFSSISKFVKSLKDTGVPIEGVLIKDDMKYELYIESTKNMDTIVIHIKGGDKMNDELANTISFLSYLKSQGSKLHVSDINVESPPNVYYTEIK